MHTHTYAGAKHSAHVEMEAARVFGEGSDLRHEMTRPAKYVEANAIEVCGCMHMYVRLVVAR